MNYTFYAAILAILGILTYGDHAESTQKKALINSPENWGLAKIDILKAWEVTRGHKDVVVAVIDTGVQADHPDLPGVMWGKSFTPPFGDHSDVNGHGTHVAGIVRKVAPGVSILPIKYYSSNNTGPQNLHYAIKAVDYAIKRRVDIINFSAGGMRFVEAEYLTLLRARQAGILVVAAAGNNEADIDDRLEKRFFPCAYELSNVLCVTGTDEKDVVGARFNYGKKSVDIAAPGVRISSTYPKNGRAALSGSSQATAFVSGVAALLKSKKTQLTPEQLSEIIIKEADTTPNLKGKVRSESRLNAGKALRSLK